MNKEKLLLNLCVINDDLNLLKDKNQSVEEYEIEKKQAYNRLYDFIRLKAED